MKLKYYLRGMGIGIVLTAIVMGFALGGRKSTISDAEVIERAKALGMVDASGVLTQPADNFGADEEGLTNSKVGDLPEGKDISDDSSASLSSLDKEGEEISEENDQGVAGASEPLSEVAKEEKKDNNKKSEKTSPGDEASKEASSDLQNSDTAKKSTSGKTSDNDNAAAEASNKTPAAQNQEKSQVKASEASEQASNTEQELSSALGNTTTVTKTITIPGGLGSDQVAQILYKEGVIDNATSFNNYLIDRKMDRIIRSGVKTIPAGSTYEDIARIICKG